MKDESKKHGGWADHEDISSLEVAMRFDSFGRPPYMQGFLPRNPDGRTGRGGRGLLGRWGPNFSADPLVTRRGATGVEILVIMREDTLDWSFPGCLVMKGETTAQAMRRGFDEHAKADTKEVDALFASGIEVYRGYVNDPLNTDNAWVETTCVHMHIEGPLCLELKPGKGSKWTRWMPLGVELHANQGEMLQLAIDKRPELFA